MRPEFPVFPGETRVVETEKARCLLDVSSVSYCFHWLETEREKKHPTRGERARFLTRVFFFTGNTGNTGNIQHLCGFSCFQ